MSGEYQPLAWQVKEDGFGYPSVYETNEDGGAGDLVCHAFSNHVDLICAAPELLEALEGLMIHRPDHGDTAWQNAEEAIAKAKGETL